MIELDTAMKDCIIDAMAEYPDLDIPDTVIRAFSKYVNLVGHPIQIENEAEGEEFFQKAALFLLDCVLCSLIEKGLVEVVGMEDNDFVYGTTIEF